MVSFSVVIIWWPVYPCAHPPHRLSWRWQYKQVQGSYKYWQTQWHRVFPLPGIFFCVQHAVSFLSNSLSFRAQRHFVHSKTLYIHALANIVSLSDAHAFRSQREIIVFCYPQNLVISSACWCHWLVNLAFRNARSCNSWWGLQAFLYVFCTFHVVIFSNMMWKALCARDDFSVT